jgi:predicted TIM-barrel fold metal-dependent hydrolase
VQIIRIMLSGVFDRFPDLQIITGHWGEVVLFYLERISGMEKAAKLQRSIADYAKHNLYVTPSGMFSARYLRWTVEMLGIERIMFSSDYPYRFAPNGGARAFIDQAELGIEDKEKFAHGNWDALTSR